MYQRKKEHDDGGLVLQMEKREREKKGVNPKLLKYYIHMHATVTVYICMVTVASG